MSTWVSCVFYFYINHLLLMIILPNDIILCQITSHQTKDKYAIAIKDNDFKIDKLKVSSNTAKPYLYCRQKYYH